MNYWTQQSIEFAGQRNYPDELFKFLPFVSSYIHCKC
ncbi:MAG: hypothetical protein IJU07_02830 [Synergistaceae bacterium]|nr:hypothetical protein [Synergistaceae bacterium]